MYINQTRSKTVYLVESLSQHWNQLGAAQSIVLSFIKGAAVLEGAQDKDMPCYFSKLDSQTDIAFLRSWD